MSDDSEIRFNGPFQNADEVIRQFANWSAEMPSVLSSSEVAAMLLREGLMIAGVTPSDFELEYARIHGLDPAMTQIVVAWLIRSVLVSNAKKALDLAGYQPKSLPRRTDESSDTSGQSSTP